MRITHTGRDDFVRKVGPFSNGSLYPSGPGYDMHIAVAIYFHIETLPSNLVLMDPLTRTRIIIMTPLQIQFGINLSCTHDRGCELEGSSLLSGLKSFL